MQKIQTLKERILNKITKDDDGCWVWSGAKFKKNSGNYGQIRIGGRKDGKLVRAHKISYQEFVGEIPKGLELDHLCHNTLCVNPKHLEPVIHAENMKRRKDSNLPYCKHGHKYTPRTTYIRPDNGYRECKICRKLKVASITN